MNFLANYLSFIRVPSLKKEEVNAFDTIDDTICATFKHAIVVPYKTENASSLINSDDEAKEKAKA